MWPEGEPTLGAALSMGVLPRPERLCRVVSSSAVREKRRIFSCGVSSSWREFGTRSSSKAKFSSSQSSALIGGRAPRDAERSLGLEKRSECIMRLPMGSSAVFGGEDPRPFKTLRCSPKAELCRLRRADGSVVLPVNEDGGDGSKPKRPGIDAAIGP
mgnify:CR=1 FL=1